MSGRTSANSCRRWLCAFVGGFLLVGLFVLHLAVCVADGRVHPAIAAQETTAVAATSSTATAPADRDGGHQCRIPLLESRILYEQGTSGESAPVTTPTTGGWPAPGHPLPRAHADPPHPGERGRDVLTSICVART
ncbi:hypothetical protein [Saccharothrix obliqua]|uniref:hypothetical protein n=1 Tax=Saccharothrix obliqua TaxID=2861747 RepID=UPI001C5F4DC7|nr:hypothetical protein [Saccharothrix obliqua]MBW4721513.1 hypothetical protein [Saccharothrix obliqua]